jgi:enamine deaminase RidA (YjgF/YER057c/UK114 family)
MKRRLISSGSSWEERYGYSRAVVTGTHVHVAGTAPIMPGDADPPSEPYEQMRRCLEIAEAALHEAGASLSDVVRTRVLMTDAGYAPEVMRAHGEAFAATRPACTGVVVGLLDPRWLVELEIDAVIGQGEAAT